VYVYSRSGLVTQHAWMTEKSKPTIQKGKKTKTKKDGTFANIQMRVQQGLHRERVNILIHHHTYFNILYTS